MEASKNEQEQIEEVAKIISKVNDACFSTSCKCCNYDNIVVGCKDYRIAEALYNADYRKAEEVRKETAEEIVGLINNAIFAYLGVKSLEEAEKLSLIDSTLTYDIVTDKLQIISQKYGVEVE